ncbi:MAG: hypothetical protein EXR71_10095 [Myxococcales bacterium]|nr:hypothetical protein [Myxococcales bacterium]
MVQLPIVQRLVFAGVLCATVGLTTVAQPRLDATRRVRNLDAVLVFFPSAEGVRMSSSGFEDVAADLMWVRTVLLFGERYGSSEDPAWIEWLTRMIGTVTQLDPRWSTPYKYGGSMLRVVGAIDESSAVFARCTEERPDDAWCPLSRGMNDLIYKDDPGAAAEWVARAATRKSAPPWYGGLSAALRDKAGSRRAGLAYLEEQLTTATDPAVIESLNYQRAKLLHNELVAGWEAACLAWRDEHGPLARPSDLATLGIVLPENPRGDPWVVGADGVVRGEGAEGERLRVQRRDEWKLLRR